MAQKIHSPEMAEVILDINTKLLVNFDAYVVQGALESMGSGCLFDDCENDEQVKGAMLVLNWIKRNINA